MSSWRNSTGHPLSSPDWLDAHHRAKLHERTRFAEKIAALKPRKLVDLGCASGLWLDLLDKVLPTDCELVGIDSDPEVLALARQRAAVWARPSDFMQFDITSEPERIPVDADVLLAFHLLSYLKDMPSLFEGLYEPRRQYRLIVRQYDGGTIRIGPLSSDDRLEIDSSLRASLDSSSEFSYYALDRTYTTLVQSQLTVESLEFELIQRHTPFSVEFLDYFNGTVAWMRDHLSEESRDRLDRMTTGPLYFSEVDLVAVLLGGG